MSFCITIAASCGWVFASKTENESASILPTKVKKYPEIEDEAFPRDSLRKKVDWVCYAEDITCCFLVNFFKNPSQTSTQSN